VGKLHHIWEFFKCWKIPRFTYLIRCPFVSTFHWDINLWNKMGLFTPWEEIIQMLKNSQICLPYQVSLFVHVQQTHQSMVVFKWSKLRHRRKFFRNWKIHRFALSCVSFSPGLAYAWICGIISRWSRKGELTGGFPKLLFEMPSQTDSWFCAPSVV
jgi:hypothetical protein